MIRTFGLLNSYFPIYKVGENVYNICWDYEEVKNPVYAELSEEDKQKEEAGELVERTVLRYESSNSGTWMIEAFYTKPELQTIKNLILGWYNSLIDNKILSGFKWKNMPIWLSSENQFNYKAAYDLAVQSNGQTLPITFKFGPQESPVYYTFNNLEDLNDFYTSAINHINQTLQEGWQVKDSIDWSKYELTEA